MRIEVKEYEIVVKLTTEDAGNIYEDLNQLQIVNTITDDLREALEPFNPEEDN